MIEPSYTFDIDKDGKKDVIVFQENGTQMVYVSLRFLIASAVSGVAAAVASMHYLF